MLMALVVLLLWIGVLPTRIAASAADGPTDPQWFRWSAPILAVGLLISLALSSRVPNEQPAATPQLPPPTRPAIWGAMPSSENQTAPQGAQPGGDLNVMVQRLAQKLASAPNNGEGWLLMARTRLELRQYPEAAEAFGKAVALLPPDANLLADWADAQVIANAGKWNPGSHDIVQRALKLDPAHPKALTLAGSEAFANGSYQQAIELWRRVQKNTKPDSIEGKLAEANIAEAKKRQGTLKDK
ncbi:tetratricopeptide repeat protein [Niveibacterium sp.]|uniref:tetratricopeptide repeat protein n=1 Tax=Niveibacterium sp. TaxID=2017444 RepID=UPI0035AE97FC